VFWLLDMMIKFWKFGDWDDWKIHPWSALTLIFFFLTVFWAFYSIVWAPLKNVAWVNAGELLGVFGLVGYIVLVVKNNRKRWVNIFLVIAIGLLIQTIWGIGQYIWQHDFGFWWLGESILGPLVEGVAKVDVGGDKLIRAYGSLPHANVFGFYMFASVVVFLAYYIVSISPVVTKKNMQYAISNMQLVKNVLLGFVCGLIMMGVLVSYARVVWLAGLIIGGGFIVNWWLVNKENFSIKSVWKFDYQKVGFVIFLLVVGTGLYFNWNVIGVRSEVDQLNSDVSLNTRKIYDGVAGRMIEDRYYNGFGVGNFVYVLPYFAVDDLLPWMHQPVHNTFKLVWAELGVIGFLGFGLMMLSLLATLIFSDNKWKWWWVSVWLSMILLMMFDHYMWDIWQGQLMFGLLIGLMLVFGGSKKIICKIQ
jgi:O-antigen ligase